MDVRRVNTEVRLVGFHPLQKDKIWTLRILNVL
jgi:hypothetical protein